MTKFKDLFEAETITVDLGYGTKSRFGDAESLYMALDGIEFTSKLDIRNDTVTLSFKNSKDRKAAEKIIYG
jgi:hypothetical protein